MDAYRVKVTVRNNLLLSAIEAAGYKSQSEFSRAADIDIQQVNHLCGMRVSPLKVSGSFTKLALDVMEVLGASPSDLWTERQLTVCLSRSSGERSISEGDVQDLLENQLQCMTLPDPSDAMFAKERSSIVEQALSTLSPRTAEIIKARLDEQTYEQIGNALEISTARVRQIEANGLRLLRHPKQKALRDLVEI